MPQYIHNLPLEVRDEDLAESIFEAVFCLCEVSFLPKAVAQATPCIHSRWVKLHLLNPIMLSESIAKVFPPKRE